MNKCPHCEYTEVDENYNENELGFFWRPSNRIILERKTISIFSETEKCQLLGCPNCKKTFIND